MERGIRAYLMLYIFPELLPGNCSQGTADNRESAGELFARLVFLWQDSDHHTQMLGR
jgi:hypothetical protein